MEKGKKIEEKNEGKNGIDLGNLKSIKNFKHFFFYQLLPHPHVSSVSPIFSLKKNLENRLSHDGFSTLFLLHIKSNCISRSKIQKVQKFTQYNIKITCYCKYLNLLL